VASFISDQLSNVAYWHKADIWRLPINVRFRRDIVAKVFLHWGSKILRAAGAYFA
jgi:hypothetical protein